MSALRAVTDAIERMPVIWWRSLIRACIVVGIFFAVAEMLNMTYFPSPIHYLRQPIQADAALYYRDARVAIEYGWRQLDDPLKWDAVTHRLKIVRPDPPGPSLYPPLQTAIILPFALLPFPVAYWMWLAAMLACLVFIVWQAMPRVVMGWRGAALLCIIYTPIPFGLAHGQVTYIVGAAVVGAWVLLRHNRPFLAGVALTLILLKPEIALLAPLALLVSGRWRAFAGFCTSVGAVLLGYLLTLPLSTLIAYADRLRIAAENPSRWYGMPHVSFASIPGWPGVALEGMVVILVAAVAWYGRRLPEGDAIAIGASLIGSILVAHYVHYQDFLVLLIAGFWLLALAPNRSTKLFLAVAYLAIEAENLVGDGQTMAVCMVGLMALLVIASERGRAVVLQHQAAAAAA